MGDKLSLVLALTGIAIALASAAFTAGQALAASKALKQGRLNRMFSSLDFSSQLAFSNPDVVYAVHGLDKAIPEEEVKNIIYFSVVLDVFQAHWSDEFNGDFAKAGREFRKKSRYLNQILRVPDNPEAMGDHKTSVLRRVR